MMMEKKVCKVCEIRESLSGPYAGVFTGLGICYQCAMDYREGRKIPPEIEEQVKFRDTHPNWREEKRLISLANSWEQLARRKWKDAESEKDLMGKKLIEHGAICYLNCATELRKMIEE